MDNTIDFIDSCKHCLRQSYEIYFDSNENEDFRFLITDEDFQKLRRILIGIAKGHSDIKVPNVILECRTVTEFCHDLSLSVRDYNEAVSYISMVLNTFANYLEDNMYEVQMVKIECELPKYLTYESIINDFENCEKRIQTKDYAGAITSARSMLEGACKELLLKFDIDLEDKKPDVPTLFKNVRNVLNLDPSNKDLENSLRNIITGLNKVVDGLNEIRNKSGDGHSKQRNPSYHHAVLTVNAAKTIVSFLFQTYEYQKEKGILIK